MLVTLYVTDLFLGQKNEIQLKMNFIFNFNFLYLQTLTIHHFKAEKHQESRILQQIPARPYKFSEDILLTAYSLLLQEDQ